MNRSIDFDPECDKDLIGSTINCIIEDAKMLLDVQGESRQLKTHRARELAQKAFAAAIELRFLLNEQFEDDGS